MKKVLITLSIVALTMVTFAQKFDLGIKASLNNTKLSSDLSTFSPNAQGGYNFGVFGRFGGKSVYFQPEFLYVVKNGGFNVSTASGAVKMKSIQIPALLGVNLLNLKVATIHAFTGPAFSYIADGSSENTGNYLVNNFKSTVWDYQLGAGVDVLMFTVDIRYEWGLTKEFDASYLGSNFTNKGNTFAVSLGYRFF
jgi:hypothetical protein